MKKHHLRYLLTVPMLASTTLLGFLTFAIGGNKEKTEGKTFDRWGKLPLELQVMVLGHLAQSGPYALDAVHLTSHSMNQLLTGAASDNHLTNNLSSYIDGLIQELKDLEDNCSPARIVDIHTRLLALFGIKILRGYDNIMHAYYFQSQDKSNQASRAFLNHKLYEFYKRIITKANTTTYHDIQDEDEDSHFASDNTTSPLDAIQHIAWSPLIRDNAYEAWIRLIGQYLEQGNVYEKFELSAMSLFYAIAPTTPEKFIPACVRFLEHSSIQGLDPRKKDATVAMCLPALLMNHKVPFKSIWQHLSKHSNLKASISENELPGEFYVGAAHSLNLGPEDVQALKDLADETIREVSGKWAAYPLYEALAGNQSLSTEYLMWVYDQVKDMPEKDAKTYLTLVQNKNCSQELLEKICEDAKTIPVPSPSPWMGDSDLLCLVRVIVHHKNVPEDVKQIFTKMYTGHNLELTEEDEHLLGVRLN